MMPSDDLPLHCQEELRVLRRWGWDRTHCQRTAEAWLRNMDQRRDLLMPFFRATYGKDADAWRRHDDCLVGSGPGRNRRRGPGRGLEPGGARVGTSDGYGGRYRGQLRVLLGDQPIDAAVGLPYQPRSHPRSISLSRCFDATARDRRRWC